MIPIDCLLISGLSAISITVHVQPQEVCEYLRKVGYLKGEFLEEGWFRVSISWTLRAANGMSWKLLPKQKFQTMLKRDFMGER